ncbi:MFS transporter [Nonomuraea sp. KC401]|uniref:MFS transporter n=1 Tax=unclassified Nonomuraea TaxID=2593643 RepID=UPI0010FCF0FF|nr:MULTISPECIES: MFS transporter [unclassified Nonomuraea]NBE94877.1 MFS transporter [Nonomuraea sp. K271]TLF72265.1 MFS transporter [Nonomuraea sp. KC401]
MSASDGSTGTEPGALSGLQLLRHSAGFRSLWSARVVSVGGDALSLVALMLHVAGTTGQAIAVSLLLLVGDFVPSLLSPIAGAISDRFDLKRVMIACELAQGVVLLLIAVSLPPLPLLLVLVGLRAIGGQVFLPASRAAIPGLVRDKDLETANATLGFGTNAAEALGPLAAAALLPFVGIRGVLLVDAVSFLLAGAALLRLRSLPPAHSPEGTPPSLLEDAKSGLGYIWSTRVVRVIALGFCAIVAFNGVDDVALVLLATDTFAAGDSAVGLLLGAVGIGLLLGYALTARYSARVSLATLLVAGFAVNSAGNRLTGLAWAVAAAFATQFVRGFGIAAMDVATNTMLQRLVPAGMLGRVFGNLYGAVGVAAALSYIAGGFLLDATSAPVTLLIAGGGGLLTTVLVAWALPGALRKRAGGPGPDGTGTRSGTQ